MPNDQVILASGRTIQLRSLRQWAVYGGLIEGLPTRKMNDATIDRLRCEARVSSGHEPFLIPPKQSPIEYHGRYPLGEPAVLPRIGCVAEFVSSGDDVLCYTQLTVIWFQHDYAFPLSAEAERALIVLDWESVADRQEL